MTESIFNFLSEGKFTTYLYLTQPFLFAGILLLKQTNYSYENFKIIHYSYLVALLYRLQ